MQQRVRSAEQRGAVVAADRPDVPDQIAVQARGDALRVVFLVLDDARENQRPLHLFGEVDGFRRSFVRMNPPEEQQVTLRLRHRIEAWRE